MLYRIVRMEFEASRKDDFIRAFYSKQPFIKAFPGCIDVALMQDERDVNSMATWSLWESNNDLEAYRSSDLFKETWDNVKPMFSGKPKAYSLTKHKQIAND